MDEKMPASKKESGFQEGGLEAGLRLGAFLEGFVWRDMNARQTHFLKPLPGGSIGVWHWDGSPHTGYVPKLLRQAAGSVNQRKPLYALGKNTYYRPVSWAFCLAEQL
ncbi:MAG: hypothetical protein LC657_06635 [Desulfobacteraceae bacterium]|nr:hypothetical protein [Desulfobacteraceae bacterium]